ncbi:unnamed protein product [Durusdinium trenchii]|uniref:RanBP2-type domain-containing protein n=2 Tax=Durusdinium trenchii TaxID=1381693 RepID=A0ABP0MCH3_9DINO
MPRSWKSSDYICPGCKNWNLGKNMNCMTCNHPKPTINTMGERAHDFYPLAGQKMYCNGQKNCPECHAIVHISHSECLACRDRKQNMRAINTHQACVVTTATGSKDAMRSDSIHAIMAPENLAKAAPKPKTAVDALEDKYRGLDPLAIIDDLERVKAGEGKTIDAMEEKRRILEEQEKEKEREKERERQRQEQEEENKKSLEVAKLQAEAMEADRKRKREAASDLISAMLDAQQAEESAADVRGDESGADGPADTVEDAEKRRRKLLEQAEELKKKQEEMKQRQAAEEQARRQRMRERRQQRKAETAVVLD